MGEEGEIEYTYVLERLTNKEIVFQFDFQEPLEIIPQDQFILRLDFAAFENGIKPNAII